MLLVCTGSDRLLRLNSKSALYPDILRQPRQEFVSGSWPTMRWSTVSTTFPSRGSWTDAVMILCGFCEMLASPWW